MIALIRRWLKTSGPIENISAEAVSTFLQNLTGEGRFAVFELPKRAPFAQVKGISSGGLHVEVSRRTPELESLLRTLGDVTLTSSFGFPTATTAAGGDDRAAQVIAQALVLLAADSHVANVVRVRTGSG